MLPTVTVRGLSFMDAPANAVVRYCDAIRRVQGYCAVMTPNAVMLAEAERRAATRALLRRADLRLPDGEGILLAARGEGKRFRYGKQAGVDFGEALVAYGAARGYRIFLYGGRPGVAEKAAERLGNAYRGLKVAGVLDGYGDPRLAACRIAEAHAEIVLVCLGFPKQERWIERHKRECGAILCGLGGSLDVYAGAVKRAPLVWQKMKLEWLYRCLREPKRFVRLGRAAALFW